MSMDTDIESILGTSPYFSYLSDDYDVDEVRHVRVPLEDTDTDNDEDIDVLLCVDDSDDSDEERNEAEFLKSIHSAPSMSRAHSRRPSVRSVNGSTHQFTVINYDEGKDDDDSYQTLPAITARSPFITSSAKRGSIPEVKANDVSHPRLPPHYHRSSILQRSLSLQDGQDHVREAVQNNTYLNNNYLSLPSRKSLHDVAVDVVDGPKNVYKTRDWYKPDVIEVARWGRVFGKRKRNRLMHKSGEYNITHVNQAKKNKRYMLDIFTTLLEMRWRYTLLLLMVTFVFGWIVFALLWWGISARANKQCVIGVHDFVTALLFSIETQQTIGYGTRAVTAECAVGTLLVMVQSVFGVLIQCVLTGLVFAKLARAKKRGETLMFSKNAVISRHRGDLCLMFQIADMRRAHMICVSVSGLMVKHSKLQQGDMAQSMRHYRLALHTELDDFLFLAMPVRVIHTIDEHSPLYDMSPEQLLMEDFEIIVVLEGVNETTGMSTQVRTSYLPGEIMWGHKHGALITNQRKNGVYNIDYTRFNDVVPVDTPELSARQMREQGKINARRASTKSTVFSPPPRTYMPQISTVAETDERSVSFSL